MKFTQIPSTAFQNIQLNAGILVDSFNPATGVIGNLLGATTGGVNFTDNMEFIDFGEDIDNCPKNTKELKQLDSHDVKMSGTFVTISAATAKLLAATADVDGFDDTHIIPRNDILQTDFNTLWWVGDYSDENNGDNAGFVAIKMLNALNTGGFQIQSTDKGKGQFAFEFTGHYSMNAQDTVPYEVYIKQGAGSGETVASIFLDKHSLDLDEDDTYTFTVSKTPADASVTWSSADTNVATVSNGTVTAVAVGNTIITASITVEGVTYNDTCTVVVNA